MGVSARLAANGVFRPFGPLYIPFGEQGHSCIKGCLVRVAAQVSPLRIVSQLEIKGNSAIYLHSILNIFSHNCFLSSIVTTNGFFFFFLWVGRRIRGDVFKNTDSSTTSRTRLYRRRKGRVNSSASCLSAKIQSLLVLLLWLTETTGAEV